MELPTILFPFSDVLINLSFLLQKKKVPMCCKFGLKAPNTKNTEVYQKKRACRKMGR
jgi:hypothetical protein